MINRGSFQMWCWALLAEDAEQRGSCWWQALPQILTHR